VFETVIPELGAPTTFGYDNIVNMRIGKRFDLIVEADDLADAETKIREMCRNCLVNMIIEKYEIQHITECEVSS
jgi:phosphoribosylformylglycinamidine synthase